ncbi:MAG: hypothetical protein ACMG6S_32595 [Byssovorax sp.]
MRSFALLLGLALVSSLAAAAGCTGVADFHNCTPDEVARFGCDGCPVTCREHPDAGTEAAATCAGPCVPLSLPEWSEAILLWYGPAAEAPACPIWAPVAASDYHAGLTPAPEMTCGACSCDPPAGSCALPPWITADSQPLCSGNSTTFDAPAGWTGACTAANAIPAGKLCNGVPCVQSLSIAPLTMNESGCSPSVAPPPSKTPEPATWSTAALVCVGKPSGLCADPGEACAPVVPDPLPGFLVCIIRDGDRTCPEGWPDKHVFFDHVNDDRTCSPCACSTPSGSSCAGSISVFKDSDCSVPLPLTLPLDATGPSCSSIPAGSALGSKAAGPVTYTPGTCQPTGGEALGATTPAEPSTFCCRL